MKRYMKKLALKEKELADLKASMYLDGGMESTATADSMGPASVSTADAQSGPEGSSELCGFTSKFSMLVSVVLVAAKLASSAYSAYTRE